MSIAELPSQTASDRREQPDQTAAIGGARPDELETPEYLVESGKIRARGTTPRRVLENSLACGLNGEFEVSGPLRTTRNLRLGRA